MQTAPLLLVATAGGLGFLHAILPDHWVPLGVAGRTQGWGLFRVGRLAALAGSAHVIASFVLAAAMVAVGLQFQSQVAGVQGKIVGAILLITGLGFLVFGGGHVHDHDDHSHHHDPHPTHRGVMGKFAAVAVPFGVAASPDLTVLPVVLAATVYGLATVIGVLLVFGAVTIASFVGLTVACTALGYQLQGRWIERNANLITAAALVLIGALVIRGM